MKLVGKIVAALYNCELAHRSKIDPKKHLWVEIVLNHDHGTFLFKVLLRLSPEYCSAIVQK